ncbi:hypothetical protein Gpo141_00001527 [Globisporangium polare]
MSFAYIPPPFPFPEAWPQLFQTLQTTWLSPGITTLPSPPPPTAPAHLQGRFNSASVYGAPHPSAPFAAFPPPESVARRSAHDEDAQSSESASHDRGSGASSSSDEDGSDGEYVYGYVLSDEWRGRFRNSLQARQRQQQQQRSQHQREQRAAANHKQPAAAKQNYSHKTDKRKQQQHFPSASDHRAMDLQRELAAAKERETTQRRPIAPAACGATPSAGAQEVRRLETQLNLRFDEFCDAFLPVVWPHDAVHK